MKSAMTERQRKARRRRMKRRLRSAVEKVWGSPHAAIAATAAPKALYRWLDIDRTELPRADDLERLCEAGNISLEWVIFDRGDMLTLRQPTLAAFGMPGERWTADDAHAFGLLLRGYFHSIAVDQLRRRFTDVELIEAADDPESTADVSNFGNELLGQVALEDHAGAVEGAVRDRIDRNIDTQLAALYRQSVST